MSRERELIDEFNALCEAKQTELKMLPDDELIKRDIELWEREAKREDSPLGGMYVPGSKADIAAQDDRVLTVAMYREVHRRATAACWLWRRLFFRGGRKNCKKWLAHLERRENAAKRVAEKVLARTHPGVHLDW